MTGHGKHAERDGTNNRINEIVLSTGNVNRKYIVRDIIFAADRLEVDLFDPSLDTNALFSTVSYKLKEKAFEYGAHAVINCHFEHEQIKKGDTYILEVFAYGTVIQFIQTNIG
ncbi:MULTISPECIES: heavy metal-binding domain-containing protein [unclassified Enterococcus]|jgi:hypothetical protein|uniref:heavy metal-binding domain-containing protein n=1 Tax=unclassified Enterococcus TaxID=2608891 RepID=UPI000352FFE4|nr:hypothetical protein D920_00351 [Enterococcus faecalis 13-SD-W-01]